MHDFSQQPPTSPDDTYRIRRARSPYHDYAARLRLDYAVSALGNRVVKSRIPTHVGVMGMRAMGLPRSVDTHAGPCSRPKYRSAESAYSGTTSSSISTSAVPRTISTLYGHPWSSIVSATCGLAASALSLGALAGEPMTSCSPVQWNQTGTTRGVPSIHVYASRAGIVEPRSFTATGS